MQKRKRYFTPEGYRRLAQNPFVDDTMLQFIRRKASMPQQDTVSASRSGYGRPSSQKVSKSSHLPPSINEKTAQLIAAAIRGLLRE